MSRSGFAASTGPTSPGCCLTQMQRSKKILLCNCLSHVTHILRRTETRIPRTCTSSGDVGSACKMYPKGEFGGRKMLPERRSWIAFFAIRPVGSGRFAWSVRSFSTLTHNRFDSGVYVKVNIFEMLFHTVKHARLWPRYTKAASSVYSS